jgi:urease subunit alpha
MFAAFGRSLTATSVTFVSGAAKESGLSERLGVAKDLVPVRGTRDTAKAAMVHNALTPNVTVDPETYEVRIDGELITCEPASVLPMAQRYFLY